MQAVQMNSIQFFYYYFFVVVLVVFVPGNIFVNTFFKAMLKRRKKNIDLGDVMYYVNNFSFTSRKDRLTKI